MYKIDKYRKTESRLVVAWSLECKGIVNMVFFWGGGGDENVPNLDHGNSCTAVNILKIIEFYTLNECIV